MDKKKIIIGSIITIVVLAIIGTFSYFYFIKEDEQTTLTLADKKWIEDNKNTVIDLGILKHLVSGDVLVLSGREINKWLNNSKKDVIR